MVSLHGSIEVTRGPDTMREPFGWFRIRFGNASWMLVLRAEANEGTHQQRHQNPHWAI